MTVRTESQKLHRFFMPFQKRVQRLLGFQVPKNDAVVITRHRQKLAIRTEGDPGTPLSLHLANGPVAAWVPDFCVPIPPHRGQGAPIRAERNPGHGPGVSLEHALEARLFAESRQQGAAGFPGVFHPAGLHTQQEGQVQLAFRQVVGLGGKLAGERIRPRCPAT